MTLSEYLAANNLTQTEFAARVGVKQATIARYARGERFPRLKHLAAIQKETGGTVTADDHVRARESAERASA
jgi:transcriptional regulator with XRE-family HTH domain